MQLGTRVSRDSAQRRVILEELRRLRSHPRSDELHALVRRRMPRISLGTVYRNLERLRQEGAALEIYCGDFVRYDGNVRPHGHFLCQTCRRVWDLDDDDGTASAAAGLSLAGFRVDGRYTTYYGLCPDCHPCSIGEAGRRSDYDGP